MEKITSKTNPHIKQLAKLMKSKKERDTYGLFVAEGARLCFDIAESGLNVVKTFITAEAMHKYPMQAKGLVEVSKEVFEIPQSLGESIANTKNPQGIFAVIEKPKNNCGEIHPGGYYVILDNVQDPGNVGTLLRTALAFGINGVFLTGDCADIYSPKVLRGSMGAVAKLQIFTNRDFNLAVSEIHSAGLKVYAAYLGETSQKLTDELFRGGGCVVLGNEGGGLTPEQVGKCDASVIIPMDERAESLNVAIAGSVFMWEMTKWER